MSQVPNESNLSNQLNITSWIKYLKTIFTPRLERMMARNRISHTVVTWTMSFHKGQPCSSITHHLSLIELILMRLFPWEMTTRSILIKNCKFRTKLRWIQKVMRLSDLQGRLTLRYQDKWRIKEAIQIQTRWGKIPNQLFQKVIDEMTWEETSDYKNLSTLKPN
jgi:hypothetical protein